RSEDSGTQGVRAQLALSTFHRTACRRRIEPEGNLTLCIAWRAGGNVHMASDSRLSFGSAGTTDCAIKVVRMPFRIEGPMEDGKPGQMLTEGDIGLCFAGSAVAALMAKEAIAEVIYATQA